LFTESCIKDLKKCASLWQIRPHNKEVRSAILGQRTPLEASQIIYHWSPSLLVTVDNNVGEHNISGKVEVNEVTEVILP
jgi:hypothetical protein